VSVFFWLVLPVLIVVSIVTDRRYRGLRRVREQPTPEVFRDPVSGRITRVWDDDAGSRAYRDDIAG
jgi:hypothetical protein